MARNGVTIDTSQVKNNLRTYGQNSLRRAEVGMQVLMANQENRAKRNRRWTDRTSQARNSIIGTSESTGTVVRGALAIGADHGIFLEKANGGKYDIIWPTVLENQRELIELGRIAMMSGRL